MMYTSWPWSPSSNSVLPPGSRTHSSFLSSFRERRFVEVAEELDQHARELRAPQSRQDPLQELVQRLRMPGGEALEVARATVARSPRAPAR